MRIALVLSTLVCGAGLTLGAGHAYAGLQSEGFCERQLDHCLRRSRVPDPCYWEYEACINGFPYASTPRLGFERPAYRD